MVSMAERLRVREEERVERSEAKTNRGMKESGLKRGLEHGQGGEA